MRKKAERKIRLAAAELDSHEKHRLDEVRIRAGLHPKVFDKTILDMERVGTISLLSGSTKGMTGVEIRNLVRRGDIIYTTFSFTDIPDEHQEPENVDSGPELTTIMVILQHILPWEWERFEQLCMESEEKRASEKITEMIRNYIREKSK